MKYLKLFLPRGTMTTREFWMAQAVLLVMFLIVFVVSLFFAGTAGEGSPVTLNIMGLGVVFLIWANLMSLIKRCRDAGINPWWTLATWLPYVGVVAWLVISFLKTKETE